jgi:hypothetical protein
MALQKSGFDEKGKSASLKVCGNCARVSFDLDKNAANFLVEMVKFHGVEALRCWARMGSVRALGSGDGLDLDRTRVAKLIRESATFCSATRVRVFWPDIACFAWLPRTS